MSEPWKNGHDFVLYLKSGDRGTHALEPGVTTVRAAFRQDLEVPLTLDADWQVALLKLIYSHSYGNAVLKSPEDYHCQIEDVLGTGLSVRFMRLSQHKHFTHVAQVLEDLVEKLDILVLPTLSGGLYHYGQLHMEMLSTDDDDFPMNSKLDYFRRDLLDIYLTMYNSLPTTFEEVKVYLNDASRSLMGADRVKYIWTLKNSTHYGIELWAFGNYDLGESLALMMGFLEPDPDRPGQTRIVDHNTIYSPTGNNTRGNWVVSRLDTEHVGIMNEDFPLGGVRLKLNIPLLQLLYMRNRKVIFDMGAWTKDASPTLPYLREGATPTSSAMWMVSLEPGRWAIQVSPLNVVYFRQGLERVVGIRSTIGHLYRLPSLETPLTASLSNVDLSRCYAEVDIVDMSITGEKQRHLLGAIPLSSPTYGQTREYHPEHLDFRALAAPSQNLTQLRVHLRTPENVGIPFYTGLVVLWLYFRRRSGALSLTPSKMSFQGGRRVALEGQAQRELFPDNRPAHFRLRLPEMWTLDPTWEVGLMQLFLPHTWFNVMDRQVSFRIHYKSAMTVTTSLPAGAYVTLGEVVQGLFQELETNVPQIDKTAFASMKLELDEKGFYKWTFPNAVFSLLLTGLVGTGVGVSGMGDVERAILLPFGSTPSHRGNHPTRCQQQTRRSRTDTKSHHVQTQPDQRLGHHLQIFLSKHLRPLQHHRTSLRGFPDGQSHLDPWHQHPQTIAGRSVHPSRDLLSSQPIGVSRHRNRYKGQLGTSHSIPRR